MSDANAEGDHKAQEAQVLYERRQHDSKEPFTVPEQGIVHGPATADFSVQSISGKSHMSDAKANDAPRHVPSLAYWAEQAQEELEKGLSLDIKGLHTVVCIDLSDSMKHGTAWKQAKKFFTDFIEGLKNVKEKVDDEFVALTVFGQEVKVVQRLTNNYIDLQEAFDSLKPGGPTPLYGGLLMALAGVTSISTGVVNGIKIYSRVILVTDGQPTDPLLITGSDVCDPNKTTKNQVTAMQAVQNISSRSVRIDCVSVGNADLKFLTLLATSAHGKVYSFKDGGKLARRTINSCHAGRVLKLWKMMQKLGSSLGTEISMEDVMDISENEKIASLSQEEKKEVLEIAKESSKKASKEDDVFENLQHELEKYHYEFDDPAVQLPPLGTRVRRGPNWNRGREDDSGPGTIIGHHKNKRQVRVEWDKNGKSDVYSYGDQGKNDVIIVNEPRVLQSKEKIATGCSVRRGKDWMWGNQDGTPGTNGVVIKVKEDGWVWVRWPDKKKNMYRFDTDGKFDLEICPVESQIAGVSTQPGHLSTPASRHETDDVSFSNQDSSKTSEEGMVEQIEATSTASTVTVNTVVTSECTSSLVETPVMVASSETSTNSLMTTETSVATTTIPATTLHESTSTPLITSTLLTSSASATASCPASAMTGSGSINITIQDTTNEDNLDVNVPVSRVPKKSHWKQLAQKELVEAQKENMPGIHTVICVDISASMRKRPAWEQTQQFFNDFINGLVKIKEEFDVNEDQVALSVFGHEVKVVQRLSKNYTRLQQAFSALKLGGPTPMYGGLQMALAGFANPVKLGDSKHRGMPMDFEEIAGKLKHGSLPSEHSGMLKDLEELRSKLKHGSLPSEHSGMLKDLEELRSKLKHGSLPSEHSGMLKDLEELRTGNNQPVRNEETGFTNFLVENNLPLAVDDNTGLVFDKMFTGKLKHGSLPSEHSGMLKDLEELRTGNNQPVRNEETGFTNFLVENNLPLAVDDNTGLVFDKMFTGKLKHGSLPSEHSGMLKDLEELRTGNNQPVRNEETGFTNFLVENNLPLAVDDNTGLVFDKMFTGKLKHGSLPSEHSGMLKDLEELRSKLKHGSLPSEHSGMLKDLEELRKIAVRQASHFNEMLVDFGVASLSIPVVNGIKITPRIILITDGHLTDSLVAAGPDVRDSDAKAKTAVLKAVKDFAEKKICIHCVPVGDADVQFLKLVANKTGGQIISFKDGRNLARRTINILHAGHIIKQWKSMNEIGKSFGSEVSLEEVMDMPEAPQIASLSQEDKVQVLDTAKEAVKKGLVDEDEVGELDRYHYEFDDLGVNLPPLGTRVCRGPDWDRGLQDGNGLGTITGHHKTKIQVHVEWDKDGKSYFYRYGDGKNDVKIVNEPRVLQSDELIATGCHVRRGRDWRWGNQGGKPDSVGVVIKVKDDDWVWVRWPNRSKNIYRFGADGCFDLEICDPVESQTAGVTTQPRQTSPPLQHPGDPFKTMSDLQTELMKLLKKSLKKVDIDSNKFCEFDDPDIKLPSLGSRVRRGPFWNRAQDDDDGPGTIIGHNKDKRQVHVEWDKNGKCDFYRYNDQDKSEVVVVHEPRVLQSNEQIATGCHVKRGADWKWGNQDGEPGATGVVMRVQKDGCVWVRWQNKSKNIYRFGYGGHYDLEICDPVESQTAGVATQPVQQSSPQLGPETAAVPLSGQTLNTEIIETVNAKDEEKSSMLSRSSDHEKEDVKLKYENLTRLKEIISAGPDNKEAVDIVDTIKKEDDKRLKTEVFQYLAELLRCRIISREKHAKLRIWPGMTIFPAEKIKFVCLYKGKLETQLPSFFGIDIHYKDIDIPEPLIDIGDHEKLNWEIAADLDASLLQSAIEEHGDTLFKKHSNLQVICGGPFSIKNCSVIKQCTIILYCHAKGIILYGEETFPSSLNFNNKTIHVDIREGHFMLAVGRQEWHKSLCMGISIGEKGVGRAGTLGPFVALGHDEHGFLTSAHVVGKVGKEVVQPSKGDNRGQKTEKETICGTVEKFVFEPDFCNRMNGLTKTGVDAALVKLNKDRGIEATNFAEVQEADLDPIGFPPETKFHYVGGGIGCPRESREARGKMVIKYGRTTGLRKGVMALKGAMVKIDDIELYYEKWEKEFILKGQYLVDGIARYQFAEPGDSGAGVFTLDDENKLTLIGLVVGVLDARFDHRCVITPIEHILTALNLNSDDLVFHEKIEID